MKALMILLVAIPVFCNSCMENSTVPQSESIVKRDKQLDESIKWWIDPQSWDSKLAMDFWVDSIGRLDGDFFDQRPKNYVRKQVICKGTQMEFTACFKYQLLSGKKALVVFNPGTKIFTAFLVE